MIPIVVFPRSNLRGLTTLHGFDGDPVGLGKNGKPVHALGKLSDLETLFESESDHDVHLVTYSVEDSDGNILEKQPRLTKEVLGTILAAGYHVLHRTVFIDLDLKDLVGRPGKIDPPKLKWQELTPAEEQESWRKIEEARLTLADKGMEWVASHTTESGFRFVNMLAMPVPAGAAYEALVARFLTSYAIAGLPVDRACADWTRLFRAPRVTKESGVRTWEEDWYSFAIDLSDDGAYYVPSDKDLRPEECAPEVEIERTTGRGLPDQFACEQLVEFTDKGKLKTTKPGLAAKSALEDAGVYSWIFEKAPLAYPGKRHEMLTRAVGEVVGTLHGMPNISPDFVFGLLAEPAGRLGDDEDFVAKMWEMATSFWDKEELKKAQKAAVVAEKIAEVEQVQETQLARFLRGARTWCKEIEGMEDPEALEFLKEAKFGILQDARRDLFHVLMPSGYYDEHACTGTTLGKVVEQRRMQWLVPTEFEKNDGKGNLTVCKLPPHVIVDRSVRVYSTEEIRLDQRGSYLKVDGEGREVFVNVPFHLRDDIQPLFVEPIYQSWLAAAGGNKDKCDEMLYATACLLLFQYGPTAAVLLWGKRNAGKSLTALSLAECLSSRRLADGGTLTDNFNDALRQSPIVHVEEGVDKGNKGIDGSASLRRLITATSTAIEQKGRDKIWMQGVHRVLMTANSEDILWSLLGSKARHDADWKAIAERIANFEIDDGAHHWFVTRNKDWVETRSWIGTHGRTGLYAQFWMWVIKNIVRWEHGRPTLRGRLLYEGNVESQCMTELQSNSTGLREISKAINKMLAPSTKPRAVLVNGKVMVVPSSVLDEAERMNPRAYRFDLRAALNSLFDARQPPERRSFRGQQQRWKAIDGVRLLQIIEAHDVPNRVFEGLSAVAAVDSGD